jgi:hypothetical protein
MWPFQPIRLMRCKKGSERPEALGGWAASNLLASVSPAEVALLQYKKLTGTCVLSVSKEKFCTKSIDWPLVPLVDGIEQNLGCKSNEARADSG